MATTADRYVPDTNEITAKVIDGEAIIINLITGVYYSMDGVGAAIWLGIEQGASAGEIIAALAARYPSDADRIQTDVLALLDNLKGEAMLSPAAAALGAETADFTAALAAGTAYRSPELLVYRDMAEVLALDPPTPGVFDSLLKDPGENR